MVQQMVESFTMGYHFEDSSQSEIEFDGNLSISHLRACILNYNEKTAPVI